MERQLRCLAFGVCRLAAPVSVRTSSPCLPKAGAAVVLSTVYRLPEG